MVALTELQREAVSRCVHGGGNYFITGSGGTGKSTVLKQVILELRDIYHEDASKVVVTASTGAAACCISGSTLHSFAGIQLGTDAISVCIRKVRSDKFARQRWRNTEVLIVDEVSMLNVSYIEKIDAVARTVRENNKPMGGIRLLFCGDFLQLPCVDQEREQLFLSSWWKTANIQPILLRQSMRQSDAEFVADLNLMRMGLMPRGPLLPILEGKCSQHITNMQSQATRLKCRRDAAHVHNLHQLGLIRSKAVATYEAIDYGRDPGGSLSRQCPLPAMLEVKVGALVMLVRNLPNGLVNGSTGRVSGYTESMNSGAPETVPVVNMVTPVGMPIEYVASRETCTITDANGVVTWSRQQVPLILAWALTIHRSQGATLELVDADLQGCFATGQAYVACSRVTSAVGLRVSNFAPSCIKVDKDAVKYYRDMEARL